MVENLYVGGRNSNSLPADAEHYLASLLKCLQNATTNIEWNDPRGKSPIGGICIEIIAISIIVSPITCESKAIYMYVKKLEDFVVC